LVERQEGHPACKELGVSMLCDDFAHLVAPVVTTTSIILAPIKSGMVSFWYWLTCVAVESVVIVCGELTT